MVTHMGSSLSALGFVSDRMTVLTGVMANISGLYSILYASGQVIKLEDTMRDSGCNDKLEW